MMVVVNLVFQECVGYAYRIPPLDLPVVVAWKFESGSTVNELKQRCQMQVVAAGHKSKWLVNAVELEDMRLEVCASKLLLDKLVPRDCWEEAYKDQELKEGAEYRCCMSRTCGPDRLAQRNAIDTKWYDLQKDKKADAKWTIKRAIANAQRTCATTSATPSCGALISRICC